MRMKKYGYLVKVNTRFDGNHAIDRLKRLPDETEATIVYLKMLINCARDCGTLNLDGLEDGVITFYDGPLDLVVKEMAGELEEDPDDVRTALSQLRVAGLVVVNQVVV